MGHRTAILTDREKEVLRHVHALKTSTQIAHELQIAEVSVNKRIDSARRKLGGISRRQAAVLLAAEEGPEWYENLIPAEIILNRVSPDLSQAAPQIVASDGSGVTPGQSEPRSGGRRNLLDPWQRLGIIVLSMAGLAAMASVYIALLRLR